ncbi:hypothetical protein V1282_005764 [Nitrobacteraceae bacterium AZCC 2146]
MRGIGQGLGIAIREPVGPGSRDDEVVSNSNAVRRYWAFISYSHHDASWGRWLHTALESYRIPSGLVGRNSGEFTIPRRLFPIYRDRKELPSAGSLNSKIRDALNVSSALVVICSPYSALSLWVNEEIRIFKSLGKANRIFPVIVDGEPNAFDHPELSLPECFAPALRYEINPDGSVSDRRNDPIAADARPGKDGRSNALLKVIAGILQVGFNDLARRELAQKRKQRNLRIGAIAGVRLVNRTTRQLSLTDEGVAFHLRCTRILNDIEEAEAEVTKGREIAVGLLRMSSTFAFARRELAPLLHEFESQHSGLRIHLDASDRIVNLVDEGLDIAIRFGEPSDSSLIARTVAPNAYVMCASPAYLDRGGRPGELEDLLSHGRSKVQASS